MNNLQSPDFKRPIEYHDEVLAILFVSAVDEPRLKEHLKEAQFNFTSYRSTSTESQHIKYVRFEVLPAEHETAQDLSTSVELVLNNLKNESSLELRIVSVHQTEALTGLPKSAGEYDGDLAISPLTKRAGAHRTNLKRSWTSL